MKKVRKAGCARVSTQEQKKEAFIYCRSASVKQKRFSELLENQLMECVSRALSDGYLRCHCITEVASGNGSYVKESKRLKKIRKMVRSQKVEAIYVANLDRFTRNMRVMSELLSYFEKYQIKVNIIN